ncbi:hypothetical protein EXIGLDRAFT_493404 [Exidia glandulosa HHB12029]|uniref:Uncharacterized protein n=1 Tax=Exidia glandulosa HHB12029 TaxID=1314781 RepID=A0A166NB20_EXIGL|nr:hypothetical protein EXIGLDRAFT_493404 [Exidia glandulosa HHB12029]
MRSKPPANASAGTKTSTARNASTARGTDNGRGTSNAAGTSGGGGGSTKMGSGGASNGGASGSVLRVSARRTPPAAAVVAQIGTSPLLLYGPAPMQAVAPSHRGDVVMDATVDADDSVALATSTNVTATPILSVPGPLPADATSASGRQSRSASPSPVSHHLVPIVHAPQPTLPAPQPAPDPKPTSTPVTSSSRAPKAKKKASSGVQKSGRPSPASLRPAKMPVSLRVSNIATEPSKVALYSVMKTWAAAHGRSDPASFYDFLETKDGDQQYCTAYAEAERTLALPDGASTSAPRSESQMDTRE